MDLVNWIAHMRGPEFLVFYSILCLLALCISVFWASRLDPLPTFTYTAGQPSANSDPYELAWLVGGLKGLVTTALFVLRHNNLVSLSTMKVQRTAMPAERLGPIEQAVYDAVAVPRGLAELVADSRLGLALAGWTTRYTAKHTQAGYFTTPNERRRAWTAMLAGLAFVLGLGGFKLMAALSTGHRNVGFLILIAVVASIAIAVFCWPKRLNARGRKHTQELARTYSKWGDQAVNSMASETVLPLYVAILGTGILAGTQYDDLNQEFRRAFTSSGGGDGGCSSSCSGGSSCGGGGCGGGGCGGGGCGGCGG